MSYTEKYALHSADWGGGDYVIFISLTMSEYWYKSSSLTAQL